MAYPQHTPDIISGPTASGKSRQLAGQAFEAANQGHDQVMLGITRNNKQRLEYYWRQLASANPTSDISTPANILTWQAFFEQEVRHIFGPQAFHSLPESSGLILLARLIQDALPDPIHPHYFAARQPAFQKALMDWLLYGDIDGQTLETLNSDHAWLSTVLQQWQTQLQQQNLLNPKALLEKITQAIEANVFPQGASFLARPAQDQRQQLIFIDEAQALSKPHWHLLSSWQQKAPQQRRVVVAGNPEQHIISPGIPADTSYLAHWLMSAETAKHPWETLAAWCKAQENHQNISESLADQLAKTPPQNLQSHLFNSPAEEAEALARWIQQHIHNKTMVWDAEKGEQRACRWADFMVLSASQSWEQFIVDACIAQHIPIRAENISLDLREVQMAIYDTLRLLSAFEIQAQEVGKATSSALDLQLLQDEMNIAFERLLSFYSPDTLLFIGRSSDSESSLIQALQTQESGHPESAKMLLNAFISTSQEQIQNALPETEAIRTLLNTVILAPLRQTQPALDDTLEKAFFKPLSELGAQLGKLSFTEIFQQFFSLWQTLDQRDIIGHIASNDAIRLMRHYQAQGEHAPFVCLPFLTRDGLPGIYSQNPLGLFQTESELKIDQDVEIAHWRLLAFSVSRSEAYLWLSAHSKQAQQIAWPHPLLMQTLHWQWSQNTHATPLPSIESASDTIAPDEALPYEAQTLWGQLAAQTQPTPVLSQQDALTLSPTGLNTFLKCPRQYFYKHLLRLPEVRNEAASAGLLVHKLMEIFNTNVSKQQMPHTREALLSLAQRYFNWEEHHTDLLLLGFTQQDFQSLRHLNAYDREDLYLLVEDALHDLIEKGYFERLSTMARIEAEKNITGVRIPGLDCTIRGMVDAVVEHKDGTFEILDYKFYNTNRLIAAPEKLQENWQKILSPLDTDEETGLMNYINTDTSPTDYQLPLYYLALQQDPKYANKIRRTVLQMIRPAFGTAGEKGATPMTLEAYDIEAAAESHLLKDLQQHVIAPLQNTPEFKATPSQACDYCQFATICEGADVLEASSES